MAVRKEGLLRAVSCQVSVSFMVPSAARQEIIVYPLEDIGLSYSMVGAAEAWCCDLLMVQSS